MTASGKYGVVKAPRPGSGTVVVICGEHTKRVGPDGWAGDAQGHGIGPLIVVREDGSTSQVQASQMDTWVYRQGKWMKWTPREGMTLESGDFVRARFPGEEWPPQD